MEETTITLKADATVNDYVKAVRTICGHIEDQLFEKCGIENESDILNNGHVDVLGLGAITHALRNAIYNTRLIVAANS